MSEQELREGLQAAVADEPPLAFDPDALMDRANREIKRRRALFGAGLATTAVAVAAVAVPTMLGAPRGGTSPGGSGPAVMCAEASASAAPNPNEPASGVPVPPGLISDTFKVQVSGSSVPPGTTTRPSTRPSTRPTGTAWPTGTATAPATPFPTGTVRQPPTPAPEPPTPTAYPCPPSSGPPSGAEPPGSPVPPPTASGSANAGPALFPWPPQNVAPKQYTSAQLKQRATELRAHLTTRFGKVVEGATDVTVQEFGGEAAGAVADGQTYLETFVAYTLKQVHSAVGLSVFAPGAGPLPPDQCQEGEGGCTVREGPEGTRLVVTSAHVGGPDKPEMIMSVTQYRNDGTVVRATGYNYDPVAQASKPLPEMPVTEAQLTALATDPQLSF